MRAKEEQRRAEAHGAVPIRLYLPDGQHCLQASLPATAPLSAVLGLARAALAPGAAAQAYLFTTPPRTVLKDLSLSLYAAKLVPAAKVQVGLKDAPAAGPTAGAAACEGGDAAAAGLLRPEVLALVEAPPRRAAVMHEGRPAAAGAAPGGSGSGGGSVAGAGSAEAGAGAARAAGGGGKGVPKWLKLGK